MATNAIKKGDTVYAIAGGSRGNSGKVLRVDRKNGKVFVQGLNMQKKTVRRSQEKPNGGIIDVEGPIDISNVMSEERYLARKKSGDAQKSGDNA